MAWSKSQREQMNDMFGATFSALGEDPVYSPYMTPEERARLDQQLAESRSLQAANALAQPQGGPALDGKTGMAFAQPKASQNAPALRRAGGKGAALAATTMAPSAEPVAPRHYSSGGYLYAANPDGNGYQKIGRITQAPIARRTTGKTVSGDDNAFQPKSVQSSSRWQTGI